MKEGGITMPTFPEFDLSVVGQWFMDGAIALLKTNMMWFIIPGITIAAIFGAIALIKRSGKKITKG